MLEVAFHWLQSQLYTLFIQCTAGLLLVYIVCCYIIHMDNMKKPWLGKNVTD